MTPKELADKIAEYVQRSDWVSQGELINHLGEELRGECSLTTTGNVVLFVGASELFCDAVKLLQDERPHRIELAAINFLCLLIDGCPIPAGMPMAKKPPKNGYKTPHFAS